MQLFGDNQKFFLAETTTNGQLQKILLPTRWCNLAYSKTCPIVVPGQDGGQILEQENLASTITGLEPCRHFFMELS